MPVIYRRLRGAVKAAISGGGNIGYIAVSRVFGACLFLLEPG